MKTLSKRAKLNQEKIDETKLYTPQEAVTLLKETATAKFIEAAETHITLNVNPKYADQQVRSTVVLPHGNGKSIKIAALIANTSSSSITFLSIVFLRYNKISTYSCSNTITFIV